MEKRRPHWATMKEVFNRSGLQQVIKTSPDQSLFARLYGPMQRPADGFGTKLDLGSSMYFQFGDFGEKVYKLGGELADALMEVDCKVATEYLPPSDTIYCIEFPDHIRFDLKDGDYAHCAYIAVLENREGLPIVDEKMMVVGKHIAIMCPIYDEAGNLNLDVTDNINLGFDPSETVEQSIERCIKFTMRKTGIGKDLVEFVLKCMLYVNSGEPDLRDWRPEPKPKNAKAIKRWRRESISDIPMTLVGFDFKKPRIYGVDSTVVKMHQRWQPYGPARSMIKLIWIEPHERHYKNPLKSKLSGEESGNEP